MDPRSINDFETFNVSIINKEEKNIKTDIINGQASHNPLMLERKLSYDNRNSFEKNFKKNLEDDCEIINSKEDVIKDEKAFNNNERMKIYKD
jgi:hypothetical protein